MAAKSKNPVMTYDAELAKFATIAAAEAAKSAGNQNTISTKAGILSVGGTNHGQSMPAVVLADVAMNCYYRGVYDAANPEGPVCFAFAPEQDGEPMKPHKDSIMPQCATCEQCPHNQFGSAIKQDGSKGAGKACKNSQRIVTLVPGQYKDGKPEIAKDLSKLPLWTMSTPPTSTRNWSAYVVAVAQLNKRPPFGVLTKVSTRPDPKSQYLVEFSLERNLTADEYGMIRDRLPEAANVARAPFITVLKAQPAAGTAPSKGKRKYT